MRWPSALINTLDDAVSAARAGAPTALGIEGRAGFGKTTLLRSAVARLDGFHVLRVFGEPAGQADTFQLLRECGVQTAPRNVMQAARLLTELVGQRQLTGPVAVVVDDLHWLDPESVEVLATLVERVAGDRLLVLAAYRPLQLRHPSWRRLGHDVVRLDGLDHEAAAALVASYAAEAAPELAEQLRAHTGGNPLHMRALLQEHPAQVLTALAARRELPAPADLAAAVDARIASLAPDAARLLHALAVLGDRWTDASTAGAVAGTADLNIATQVLVEQELIRVDQSQATPRVRIGHAVLRAAAYQTIPTKDRQALHRAAAARLPGLGDRLQHRLAAASGPDEALAGDLESYADERHTRSLFHDAAHFRRLAASVSTDGDGRERRRLDADIDSLLARELDDVSVTDVDDTSPPHRRLVYSISMSSNKQWVRAADILASVDLDALDPVNAYRGAVMHAAMILAAGRPAATAVEPLEAAAASPQKDGAFHGLFVTTYGQVKHLTGGEDQPLWGFDDVRNIDRATMAATPEGLHQLSWRGSVLAITGATDQAVGDLTLVTNRMDEGEVELSDGVLHAFLGLAQWCRGDWRRAAISIDTALRAARNLPLHPTVLAIAPLATLVAGHDPTTQLARSRQARLDGPIPAAMYVGDVVEVVTLAFSGTPEQRRSWRASRTADFGAATPHTGIRTSRLWLLAQGLGASWASDAAAVDAWADALAQRQGLVWQTNAVAWLRGLARQLRRQHPDLAETARKGLPGLESFAALLQSDAAHLSADPAVRDRSEATLSRLGAGNYASSLLPHATALHDPLAALSDREREVATLLLEGLSYTQIAKELYVTRSTVAFHLSNAYAKTSTTNRHELAQLLRAAEP